MEPSDYFVRMWQLTGIGIVWATIMPLTYMGALGGNLGFNAIVLGIITTPILIIWLPTLGRE